MHLSHRWLRGRKLTRSASRLLLSRKTRINAAWNRRKAQNPRQKAVQVPYGVRRTNNSTCSSRLWVAQWRGNGRRILILANRWTYICPRNSESFDWPQKKLRLNFLARFSHGMISCCYFVAQKVLEPKWISLFFVVNTMERSTIHFSKLGWPLEKRRKARRIVRCFPSSIDTTSYRCRLLQPFV